MNLNFEKLGGLVPAVVQDNETNRVLMVGFMNQEALEKTQQTSLVTFYSRTRECLWTKGETSGNYLHVVDILEDCDHDTLLIKAKPDGPVCHEGWDTCFHEDNSAPGKNATIDEIGDYEFIDYLQKFIGRRFKEMPSGSYTTSLFKSGVNRMAQKVGEEAVETVIEAIDGNDERFIYEASDLLYHLIVLLTSKGYSLDDLGKELKTRHRG